MEYDLSNTKIKTFSKTRILIFGVIIGIVIFFIGFLIGFFSFKHAQDATKTPTSQGKVEDNKQEYHELFLGAISAENLGENLRFFSSRVHLAGSTRQKELAEYLGKKWNEYGLDVTLPEYKVLLSTPKPSKPNMITIENNGTIEYTIEGKMKLYPDPRKNDTVDFYPFVGYSPNKTVQGDLVYVNYGIEGDYEELEKRNITVEGKIVLARAPMINLASKKGAIGFISFPDPSRSAPEGTSENITYPNGKWLSKDAVQPWSTFGLPFSGDRRTPGLPATKGIFRKPYNESYLINIPAQPISYGQAKDFLQRLKGDVAPSSWQIPGLNITIRIGPGFTNNGSEIKLQVNTQLIMTSIYNVIGTIRGSEEPDRYVIVGNHRDSWVFGAVDALSGTTTTHEIARVLGSLLKSGWRPRRTIKICSWGGEEWGLFGSAEWVEENSKILKERAIAYVNLDISVSGHYVLRARASPLFRNITLKWAKRVKDPTNPRTSIYDTWLEKNPSPTIQGEPQLYNNFRASDYVMFYDYIGIPSSDYGYWFGYKNDSYMYPVYHTTEDTFYWMEKFVDPHFQVHKAMTQFSGGIILDLVDSPLIPYNVFDFAKVLNTCYNILERSDLMKNDNIQEEYMKYLQEVVDQFMESAKVFDISKTKVPRSNPLQLRMLNDKMVEVEKAFIAPNGLLGKPYDRHVAFNFGFKNIDDTRASFPGVTQAAYNALDNGDWDEVRRQLSLAIHTVRMATSVISSKKQIE